jgi:hypothetical protein
MYASSRIKQVHCAICSKEFSISAVFCGCDRHFCSEQCAQTEECEDTIPNSSPGVHWCILCKTEYLDSAKGHLFMMANHDPHPDLQTYANLDPNIWQFVEACMNCNMWCYEFKSYTEIPGKYEGVACGAWLEETE